MFEEEKINKIAKIKLMLKVLHNKAAKIINNGLIKFLRNKGFKVPFIKERRTKKECFLMINGKDIKIDMEALAEDVEVLAEDIKPGITTEEAIRRFVKLTNGLGRKKN